MARDIAANGETSGVGRRSLRTMSRIVMILGAMILVPLAPIRGDEPKAAHDRGTAATALTRSAGSGRWSEPTTWENGRVPGSGARVQVRAGHTVAYDAASEQPI